MTYTPPELRNLTEAANHLREQCETRSSKVRLNQITILENVASALSALQTFAKDNESPKIMLGAYLYVMDKIEQEYYVRSPKGSRLYCFLNDTVNTDAANSVSAREKLIYINQFHEFVSRGSVSDENQDLAKDIKGVLTKQLKALTNPVGKVIHAIPTEASVTKHMMTLPDDYQNAKQFANDNARFYKSKPNNSRVRLAQLSKVIAEELPCQNDEALPAGIFTRSHRIKMGALLYSGKSIAKTYWARSAKNSELYSGTQKILNMPNLDEVQQLVCLGAFKNYISDSKVRVAIEDDGRKFFGENSLLNNVDEPLERIIARIAVLESELQSTFMKNWPMTAGCATLGAILGAAPGYGAGSVLGMLAGEGRHARPVADSVASGVGSMANAILGNSSTTGYYSFVLSDFFVVSTLSRAFGKMFELAGMAAGGVAGGAVGFTFDLSYKGFRELCKRYLDYYDGHPDEMRNADVDLVRCLLTLPEDVFENDLKDKIRYLNGDENDAMQTKPAFTNVM